MKAKRFVISIEAELEAMALDEVIFARLQAEEEEAIAREEARRQYEADLEVERRLIEWLACHDMSDPEYSDIYKDVYGVRPRW